MQSCSALEELLRGRRDEAADRRWFAAHILPGLGRFVVRLNRRRVSAASLSPRTWSLATPIGRRTRAELALSLKVDRRDRIEVEGSGLAPTPAAARIVASRGTRPR